MTDTMVIAILLLQAVWNLAAASVLIKGVAGRAG